MIQKRLPSLETLELEVDFSRFSPEKIIISKQLSQKNTFTIPKLKIVLQEGYNYNLTFFVTCLEIILTYIKPLF